MKYHTADNIEVIKHEHYTQRGRPATDKNSDSISYQISAQVKLDQTKVNTTRYYLDLVLFSVLIYP